MLPVVLVLLLASMGVGIVLIVLGWRGRSINDHPVCRQCHFDLEGVYPESVTCPECGAGLKRDGAVLSGARRRMPIAIALGALMLFAPTAPIGAVTFAALTGRDVNAYKPLWLVLWEAKRADAAGAEKLADELMNRAISKKLDAGQYSRVIDTVLALQGDASKPWTEKWGDLFERARLDGVLKPAQEQKFIEQSPLFVLTTRENVQAPSVLPIKVRLGESRVGTNSMYYAPVSLRGAKVDGKPIDRVPEKNAVSPFMRQTLLLNGQPMSPNDASDYLGTIVLHGSRSPGLRFGFDGMDETLGFKLPPDLSPGTHTFEIELDVSTQSGTGGAFTIINGRVQNNSAQDKSVRITLTKTINVLPADSQVVEAIPAAEATSAQIADKIRPRSLTQSSFMFPDNRSRAWRLDFPGMDDLPVPVAYDVIVRSDGNEQLFGTLTSGKSPADDEAAGQSMTSSFSFSLSVNGVTQTSSGSTKGSRAVQGDLAFDPTQTVDIILRPSSGVASGTYDLDKYYNGEIVFKDVPVMSSPFGGPSDPFIEMQRMQDEMRSRLLNPTRNRPVRRQPT